MEVHLVFLAVMAGLVTASTSTPPPLTTTPIPSHPPTDHSVLFNLLLQLGYSDTCVAAALNTCAVSPQESQLVTVIKELRHLLQDMAQTVNKTENLPRHCKDLLDAGNELNGVHVIHPYPGQPDRRLTVYCDQTTDGGGWTVFQRRTNSTVREDFYRTWAEYELGFGNMQEEFWLGLDPLHALTSTALQELRVDLADWDGGHRYAKYGYFHIDGSDNQYRVLIGWYRGTAGNDLEIEHAGMKFSTHDKDNDKHRHYNCAQKYRGAWWYNSCYNSNLNGYQYEGTHTSLADGITWQHYRGNHYSLRQTVMMVRPAY